MKEKIIAFIVGVLIGFGLISFSGRLYYGGMVVFFFLTVINQPYTSRTGDQSVINKDAKNSKLFTLAAFGYIAGGLLTIFL